MTGWRRPAWEAYQAAVRPAQEACEAAGRAAEEGQVTG